VCLCWVRVRMCLRGWRTVSHRHLPRPDLPGLEQSRELAEWLAGPRSRALQRAGIGRRRRLLEVGSGHGVVTPELKRRARGMVVSLDRDGEALRQGAVTDIPRVAGDCRQLPFADESFDLVFFQNVLLWAPELERVVAEAARMVEPGGALVAIEPDYGGMMEHPAMGLRELWFAGLLAAGADPEVGRKLPGACEAAGLDTWVELSHLPSAAEPQAVLLLEDLPLTNQQHEEVRSLAEAVSERSGRWSPFVHVPYFLVVGSKP